MDTPTRRHPSRPGQPAPPRPLRTWAVTVFVALAATVALSAQAQPGMGPGAGHHGGPGMGMMDCDGGAGVPHPGRHGMHGKHGMHAKSGAWMSGHLSERMLDLVKATPEQRVQVRKLTDAARTDMLAQRDARQALHEKSREVFSQPEIDAAAAEALRQQMLAQHDQASKRMLQLRLDLAAALTPEQRKLLADRQALRRSMVARPLPERRTPEDRPAR